MGATKQKKQKKKLQPEDRMHRTNQPTKKEKQKTKKNKKNRKKNKKNNGGLVLCKNGSKKQKKQKNAPMFQYLKSLYYIQGLILYLFVLLCCSI